MKREIVNTHDQLVAAGGGIAIIHTSIVYGTKIWREGWAVLRVGADGRKIPTNPKAAPRHRDMMMFPYTPLQRRGRTHGERQRAAFEAVAQWVAETYGEHGPWVGNAMRDKVPARIQKAFPIRRRP